MGTFTPGDCCHLITQLVQQSDSGTADAAAGTRYHHLTGLRCYTGLFQRHYAQHGGKTGGADDHCFTAIESVRHRHQPVAVNACLRGQAAPVVFAHAPAGQQYLLASMETRIFAGVYAARKVDTWNHWKIANDFASARNGERVFIIQTGPVDINGHGPLRQAALLNRLH